MDCIWFWRQHGVHLELADQRNSTATGWAHWYARKENCLIIQIIIDHCLLQMWFCVQPVILLKIWLLLEHWQMTRQSNCGDLTPNLTLKFFSSLHFKVYVILLWWQCLSVLSSSGLMDQRWDGFGGGGDGGLDREQAPATYLDVHVLPLGNVFLRLFLVAKFGYFPGGTPH